MASKEIETAKELCLKLFKDDYGKPLVISDGQAELFNAIFLKKHTRVSVIAPTQYGKSTIIACALIARVTATSENWGIVAGRMDKARIIMAKVIQHIFDNQVFIDLLEIDKNEPLERIKRERSKDKVTFKGGGEISTFSAQTKSNKNVNDSLTGFGMPNIVEDESALIPDQFQAMIIRMLGGHADNTLVKVGNPFYRNHFFKTHNSEKYHKIFIDCYQAIQEGRYTQEFLEEAKDGMTQEQFAVLYECLFPVEEVLDASGYYRLLTDKEIANAKEKKEHSGEKFLGFDVGEGGDENVAVLRSSKYAEIVHISKIADLMTTTKIIIDLIDTHLGNGKAGSGKEKAGNVSVDATGIGSGVCSRLEELGYYINKIKWANKASKDTYLNLKAENFMKCQEWVRQGGKLQPRDEWNEFDVIRWKTDTGDHIKIKTKEELRKEGIKSPNCADSLALTFNQNEMPRVISI